MCIIDPLLPEIANEARQARRQSTSKCPHARDKETESKNDPLSQLIFAIVTTGANTHTALPAFHRLGNAFPSWQGLIDADADLIYRIIRTVPGALEKATTITHIIKAICTHFGRPTLAPLKYHKISEIRTWLEALPGVTATISEATIQFSCLHAPLSPGEQSI